jgi:hypothetical protein
MKKSKLIVAGMLLFVSACMQHGKAGNGADWAGAVQDMLGTYSGKNTEVGSSLTDTQIIAGLKEALGVGTGNVVMQLGRTGGFNLDPNIHIPLPEKLQQVDSALKLVGMNGLTQELETRMNHAAELATPRAKQLFIHSIQQMTFSDARTILFGGQQDAATKFFRRTMGTELVGDIKPIIQNTLSESGAIKAFDNITGQYNKLLMVGQLTGDAKSNLNHYVAGKAVDGIFYYVAQEEAAIRQNPAKRTTELLRKVFGAR